MAMDLSKHPCFNGSVCHKSGRIHLPIAPKCNVMCNFCNRKYDCTNESRPGVSSTILSPAQALNYLDKVIGKDKSIAVVGIAGPGDAFANPEETLETLRLVREKYPDMLFCIATNGLNIGPYIEQLARYNVTHVTITVSAVDPEVGAKIYAWIRDGKRPYRGVVGAGIILEKQLDAIKELKKRDIIVKVNSIVVPGVNDHHISEIARVVSGLGADIHNCIALCPVEDTPLAECGSPAPELMEKVRAESAKHVKQMLHCTRCRADAVGLLGKEMTDQDHDLLRQSAQAPLNPEEDRPYIAVASMEGFLVNQHLGEAASLGIFEYDKGQVKLIEKRDTPVRGGGDERWKQLAEILHDCRAVLTNGAGPSPQKVLKDHGLQTIIVEGLIEDNLAALCKGVDLKSPVRAFKCGASCSGDGTGCG